MQSNNVCISRYTAKEAPSTHLSPVKKRVKENTPPETLLHKNVSQLIDWSQQSRQPIVIADTPSPAVSVITISSDSDDDSESKHHRGR